MRNILSVYSGKLGKCMCGCSGKHTYNPQFRAEGQQRRGYVLTDEDCNARTVARIANKVLNSPDTVDEGDYAYMDTDTRSYVVYFV